jgi:phosphoribosylamine--glycine ligase
MKVLLVGGGGREHALAWRLVQDDPNVRITAAPGNPGIAPLAECVPIGATDIDKLIALARARRVDFTLVGPEAPLAGGIVDRFLAEKLPIFGPTKAAAEIETSKAFSKVLMQEAKVPTARAILATDPARAKGAARAFGAPVVIKASGLAAGKGVIVCQTVEEADRAIDDMLVGGSFGVAGREILVEEFMEGEELSVFGLTDGRVVCMLEPAQDHKRLREKDAGPNTGGMGAYAPVGIATPALRAQLLERIFHPTLEAMTAKGRPFTGLLYAGLMITADGPKVVEFNCRFGDPETQAVLPIVELSPSLTEILASVATGDGIPANASSGSRGAGVTTVLAAANYPDKPRDGDAISIPEDLGDVLVFHAGTAQRRSGELVTAGGRVLAVTGRASTFEKAQRLSREAAERITFQGKQFRRDIGWRELDRAAR